jgi:Uma2 family endonuclease
MHMQIRAFTVDEYHHLGELGIFGPEERLELLDGQILVMPPPSPAHSSTVLRLAHELIVRLGRRALVLCQDEVDLSKFSAPMPDIAILRRRDDYYRHAHPQPQDIYALIEVARSSLKYDSGRKLLAYARAGIAEYWIANLVHSNLTRFTQPNELGYAESRTFAHGEVVTLCTEPPIEFGVDELLGPPN